jgi:hypothetical protein
MKDKNDLLILACKENNFEEVKKLILESNVNINSLGKHNKTALQIACEQDNLKIAEFLIKHGAIVDTQDDYYCSPLVAAADNNNKELVKLILEQDPSIEIPNCIMDMDIDTDCVVNKEIKRLLRLSNMRYHASEKKEEEDIAYSEREKRVSEFAAKSHRDEMLEKLIIESTTENKGYKYNEIALKKFIKSLGKKFVESVFAKEEFVKTGFTVEYKYDSDKKSYSVNTKYH